MDTDLYRLGYSVRKALATFTYGQAQAGLEAAYHRVNQTVRDTRFGTSPPVVDGRPVRTRWTAGSNALQAALPLELEIYFPGRVWLGLSATGSLYRFRDGETRRSGYHRALETGLSLGHQF